MQDPNNKRKILPDDKLRTLFTFPLNMFSINKQISKHCKPAHQVNGHDEEPDRPAKKAKKAKEPRESKASKGGEETGDKAKKKGGFMVPQKLSPEMSALLGVEAATRGECQKRLVAYAKVRFQIACHTYRDSMPDLVVQCVRMPSGHALQSPPG